MTQTHQAHENPNSCGSGSPRDAISCTACMFQTRLEGASAPALVVLRCRFAHIPVLLSLLSLINARACVSPPTCVRFPTPCSCPFTYGFGAVSGLMGLAFAIYNIYKLCKKDDAALQCVLSVACHLQ